MGFIKLTDMAPLAVAKELGFFEDEGLYVTLEAQANWKILLDRTITGELDGAHMLAGQPLAATIGYGTKAHLVTPFVMDVNGNAITVSNAVWAQMKEHVPHADGRPVRPVGAQALKAVLGHVGSAGRPLQFGVVFPVSTHNYELRYWLAAGGIHPGYYSTTDTTGQTDADILLSVTPPPQMPVTLESGTIQGYCVGEPWNQQAVFMGIGVPVVTDFEIWPNRAEKVFGMRADFAATHPNTVLALTKALIRAARWLDAGDNANRLAAVRMLARSEYVGADVDVIANSMTGTFEYEKGERREVPDFNVFFREHATFPHYSDAVWYLTQMRRWGQVSDAHPDSWYRDVVARVFRPDLYLEAARRVVHDGNADESEFPWDSDGYRPPTDRNIDRVPFDGRRPNEFLGRLTIGLKGPVRAGEHAPAGGES